MLADKQNLFKYFQGLGIEGVTFGRPPMLYYAKLRCPSL